MYRKKMTNVKKDDRSSHLLSIKVPSFDANKAVDLSLDIWRSGKVAKCLLQNIVITDVSNIYKRNPLSQKRKHEFLLGEKEN